jgi:hypothetical protein
MRVFFRSIPVCVLWALPFGWWLAQPAGCPAQAVGDSYVVPYRDEMAHQPPPEVPRTYGPVEAGQEAYQRAEQERREAIARQLQTEDMVAWYHSPPGYYRYPPLPPMAYVFDGRRAARYAYRPAYVYPRSVPLGWFEAWPLVPGDIYGFPYLYRSPQPWGHQVIVIGPRTSLVRPLYEATPKVSPRGTTAAPPAPEPSQPSPSKGAPPGSDRREVIPTPPAVEPGPAHRAPSGPGEGGPREF